MPSSTDPIRPGKETARSIDTSICDATDHTDGPTEADATLQFRSLQQTRRVAEKRNVPSDHSRTMRMIRNSVARLNDDHRRITRQIIPTQRCQN
jgi:hypothetical protein